MHAFLGSVVHKGCQIFFQFGTYQHQHMQSRQSFGARTRSYHLPAQEASDPQILWSKHILAGALCIGEKE